MNWLFDKLKFWKKEPDLFTSPEPHDLGTFGSNPGLGTDAFGMNNDPFKQQESPIPQSLQQFREISPQQEQSTLQKDVEILSAKIDALRASIESMNQRIINIESIAKGEQEKQQKYRW
ncbi:MAG: hypothetical protein ABIF10_07405 [Candidatus Woesearchaeota archaeon]